MLSLGHLSPSVIAPSELKKLLIGIEDKLGAQFKLPFNPRQDIWTFYKTLTCTTVIHDDKLIVVIAIPLLDSIGTFEILKVHNIPIPRNQTSTSPALVKFNVETNYIAVNSRQTKFVVLSELEARDCTDPLKAYCTFRSPVYPIMSSKMCVINLLRNNKEDISKYCKIIIIPNTYSPRAQYLSDGHWLITSTENISFSVSCKSIAPYTITTKAPFDIIQLDSTCSAYSAYMTLLPYYHKESRYNITQTFKLFLQSYSFGYMSLWKTFDSIVPNFNEVKIPPKLKEIKEIPIDTLKQELDEMNLNLEPMPASPRYWICLLGTLGILLLLAVVIFRRRLLNWLTSKCQNLRSVKKGNEEVYRRPTVQPSAPKMEAAPPIYFEGHNVRYRPNKELSKSYLQEKYGLMSMDDLYTITDSMDLWSKTKNEVKRKSWSPDKDNSKSWSPAGVKPSEQINEDTSQLKTIITTVPVSRTGHDVNVEADANIASPSKDEKKTFNLGHNIKDLKATSIYPSLRQELKTNQ